jgi:hypothetical protein
MPNKKQEKPGINTAGGAYVDGNVNTGGGDFVGRDKKTSGGERSVVVGGSVIGGNIIVGDGNTVTNNLQNAFIPVYRAIEQSALPAQRKADLKVDVQEIAAEAAKGARADESFLARRLRNLRHMAPDIAEVAFAALAGPGAVAAVVVKQVVEKVKADASA